MCTTGRNAGQTSYSRRVESVPRSTFDPPPVIAIDTLWGEAIQHRGPKWTFSMQIWVRPARDPLQHEHGRQDRRGESQPLRGTAGCLGQQPAATGRTPSEGRRSPLTPAWGKGQGDNWPRGVAGTRTHKQALIFKEPQKNIKNLFRKNP